MSEEMKDAKLIKINDIFDLSMTSFPLSWSLKKVSLAKMVISSYDAHQETIINQQREIAELKELMREMLTQSEQDCLYIENERGGSLGIDDLYSEKIMPECMVKAKELLSGEK